MLTITDIASLRKAIKVWRDNGQRIAFVPTMGNLHAGHLKLVETAHQQADRVVVSIFVNPTQFGPHEDFASYPRTEEQDKAQLIASGVDLLFLPRAAEMYPQPLQTHISVEQLSRLHCGASRPGHFDGVALVVCKLLNLTQPEVLLLGEKDFQQLTVLKTLIDDLNFPVRVHSVPTVREADGLAMSSRNGYLNTEERAKAPLLYQALCQVRDHLLADPGSYAHHLSQQIEKLTAAGFAVDYFQVCRRQDLLPASAADQALVILIAARLGKTRLIDNLTVTRQSSQAQNPTNGA